MTPPCKMKSVNVVLIVSGITFLFLLWNYKTIFGGKKAKKQKSTRSAGNNEKFIASKAMGEAAVEMQEAQTAMILSEILSLNRAAHVLTRSGSVLDKLLKMESKKACESLIRDYELSSVMVVVKKAHHEEIEEGFKKIDAIESKKVDKAQEEKAVKINADNKQEGEHHHHTTDDALRIALYCKNVGRVPRVGRVVRMVESEVDHDEKYFIELIK